MRKTLGLISLLALMIAIFLAGCSDTADEEKGVKKGKDIVIAVASNFTGMDPHNTNDTLSNSAQKTMLEGLVGFDKEMNVIPLLAEDYEANDEATEFKFKLRENVEFHDGTPFNAEAVKVNFDRLADPDSGLKRHSLYRLIKETIVVSEYEVKFILSEPFGAMINTFAHPSALMHSPKSLDEHGKEVARNR
jgi:glutathione transport system substrate-binding protein